MAEVTAEEMEEVRALARINNFLPDVNATIVKSVEGVMNRASQLIQAGQMTPDVAFSLWHEVHAYRKVLKSLDVKQRTLAAQTASVRLDQGDNA